VEYGEFERALNIVRGSSLLQHALTGLARNGLIEDHDWGPRTEAHLVNSPYDEVVVAVPSIAGFELYGWAQGRADMPLERFPFEAEVFDTEPSTPRLKTAPFRIGHGGLPREREKARVLKEAVLTGDFLPL
jgi:hypothetical protein